MLKGLQYVPWVIVTDKLKSYAAAKREILPHTEHRQSRYLNNRAEVSHQPTRRRERQMQRFRSARHAQCFLSSHSRIHNHFPLRHHHLTAADTVLPAPSLFAPGARSPALPARRKPWSATSLWNCPNPQPDNAPAICPEDPHRADFAGCLPLAFRQPKGLIGSIINLQSLMVTVLN